MSRSTVAPNGLAAEWAAQAENAVFIINGGLIDFVTDEVTVQGHSAATISRSKS